MNNETSKRIIKMQWEVADKTIMEKLVRLSAISKILYAFKIDENNTTAQQQQLIKLYGETVSIIKKLDEKIVSTIGEECMFAQFVNIRMVDLFACDFNNTSSHFQVAGVNKIHTILSNLIDKALMYYYYCGGFFELCEQNEKEYLLCE